MRVSAPAFLRASKLGLSAGSPVIVLKLVDFISLFSDFSGASVPKSYTSVRAWGSYFIIYLRILFRSKEKKSLIITCHDYHNNNSWYNGDLIQGFLIQLNHAAPRDDARGGGDKYNKLTKGSTRSGVTGLTTGFGFDRSAF